MSLTSPATLLVPLQFGGLSRAEVFRQIYDVFLALGTLVGIVVIAYTVYNAYKYRDSGDATADEETPTVGELPRSSGGGKKLFVSFAISAIIVVGLIIWTYSALLYVEAQPQQSDDARQINVTGQDFAWHFEYENGVTTTSTLRVPANERVLLNVTSGDVWHTFGIPDKRVKADAIPGQTSRTWLNTGAVGEYRAECYELCGQGHSGMEATVIVMPPDKFESWLADQAEESEQDGENGGDGGDESAERLAPAALPEAAATSPVPAAVAGGERP